MLALYKASENNHQTRCVTLVSIISLAVFVREGLDYPSVSPQNLGVTDHLPMVDVLGLFQ